MAEVIFHIGMGKTGSSSLQRALHLNRTALMRDQGLEYLGLWFDLIDRQFHGYEGQVSFYSQSGDEMRDMADRFYAALQPRMTDGVDRFLISNEAIYGYPDNFSEFCNRLAEHCDVTLICYARNPVDWLPSAYVQWGVFHKAHKGRSPTFAEYAQRQIKSYAALVRWNSLATGCRFVLRRFEKGTDVVEDFAKTCNLSFDVRPERALERITPAEVVFRSVFNSEVEGEMLPHEFSKMVPVSFANNDLSIDRIIENSLEYSRAPQIVDENRSIFDTIRDGLGVELRDPQTADFPSFSGDDVRNDVVDVLVRQCIHQARALNDARERLTRLERQMAGILAQRQP